MPQSPPATPAITISLTIKGAMVPPYFWGSSGMVTSHTRLPVVRLRASKWALSVTKKTLPPRMATPRLVPSEGSETRPGVRGRE